MTHDRPYYLLRHIPAPRLRDADSSVRPHTYGVRVCSCDAFATEPCRPTACTTHATNLSSSLTDNCSLVTYHCSLSNLVSTILHSSFLILNWSHTFSAKERDAETGLSYFGARYYSSDLSIWLSVDPMADKYPSMSPYVYCADNPIMLFDPNGQKSWPIASKHQNGDRCIISGVRRNSNGAKHGGVDIVHRSPKGNLSGGTITATHNGKVTASGYSKTAGNWIQITNGDIRTSYMHMEEAPKQKVGEWISENDVVGQVGSTGRSEGPHIHYQLEINGHAVDSTNPGLPIYNPTRSSSGNKTFMAKVRLYKQKLRIK